MAQKTRKKLSKRAVAKAQLENLREAKRRLRKPTATTRAGRESDLRAQVFGASGLGRARSAGQQKGDQAKSKKKVSRRKR